jgi:hypothetical protein
LPFPLSRFPAWNLSVFPSYNFLVVRLGCPFYFNLNNRGWNAMENFGISGREEKRMEE